MPTEDGIQMLAERVSITSTPRSPLRVGYLMQNGAPPLDTLSGPTLHVRAVVDGLRDLGHQVRTLAIQGSSTSWSDDLERWQGPTYGLSDRPLYRCVESAIRRIQHDCRLPFIGLFDSVRFADACVQHLRGFDLLYERHGYMGFGGVIAARRLGVPHVLELNGNILREIDEMGVSMSSLQRGIGREATIRTFLATDHVVVVSEALLHELVSWGIPAQKISVVRNGVNLSLFARTHDEALVRSKYGLGSTEVVLFVGNFLPWHGGDLLVSAFARLAQRFERARLVLVGDGALRDTVEKQIQTLGLQEKVRLLGHLPQEQVAAITSVADVAVAPYPYDRRDIVGTPLKIMEYMAAGKAIVASTAPIHEVVLHGETGIRVVPANAQALADGIALLLADQELRTTLGANARRAAREYSWDNVVSRLNAILRSTLTQRVEPWMRRRQRPALTRSARTRG